MKQEVAMKIFFKNKSSFRDGSRVKEYGLMGQVLLRKFYAEGHRSIFFLNARKFERKVEPRNMQPHQVQ